VRELPRQLSIEELAPLFSGRTRLVDELAGHEHPLEVAEEVALGLAEEDQVAALATHPRIGEPSDEQRGAEPEVLAELERLNEEYEHRFGFSFVVCVNGRTRAALVPVLRERLTRTRAEELETGLRALCEIARSRWEQHRWTRTI
jgi:2-oxo-4-hydroxy-4-carboxy-5-ureidoimidazoline decarboxylase